MSVDAERLLIHLKEAARLVGEQFTEPDDDWAPIVHLVGREGNVWVKDIDDAFLQNADTKDLFVNGFLAQAIKNGVVTIGLVVSSWMIFRPYEPGKSTEQMMEEAARGIRPSQSPDRREQVTVTAFDISGTSLFSMAEIVRHKDSPPTLADWEDASPGEQMDGIFGGDIRRLFKKQRKKEQ